MKRIPTCIFFLLSILLLQKGYSQFSIQGQVIDEETKEPLPFVNIIINNNPLTGTSTDIHGRFVYSSAIRIETLTCSYVGYEKITRTIDSTEIGTPLLLIMHESSFALGEIVVRPGENPANRIIRNVIENKHINNPEKISSFTYTSYNKAVYDFDLSDTLNKDITKEGFEAIFKNGHLLVMESVTERRFIQPDHNEETIIGTKVSGFKEASFAPLATDIQPFSFYGDIITIIDVDYLNPISNGSLSKYDFTLEDTLFLGIDTTFILSFKPQEGKNFEALTGVLYINTFKYALQNVIAKPYKQGFIDVSLQQQYRLVDGKQWFPEQLKFELFLKQSPNMAVGVLVSGVSTIDQVELYPELDKKDFSLEEIRMHDLANKRDSLFWQEHRTISLDEKEATTYQVMDSLGEKYNFDNKLKIIERISQNRIPISFMDIDISRLVRFNKFEGVRIGLGAYTNDKLIKNFSVGGYFGYGIRDHLWKYGGEAILTIDKEKELEVIAKHDYSLQETGKSWLGIFRPRQFDFRPYLASQMDRIQRSSVSVGFRALRYAKVNLAFSNTRVDPQYAYTFQPDESSSIGSYIDTDIRVCLRYAYKEKLINSMGQRISMGTKYPVFTLAYTRGLDDVLSGQFDYQKIEARLENSIYFRNLGESKIRIDAGFISEPVPYGNLITGEGSFVRNWSVLIKNSFMTTKPYEFLSDRYVHVHYAHNFGSLLFHIDNWKPTIWVYQNIGFGSLSHPEYHQGIAFQTKEDGLYESGLQMDNLVRFNYFNVSYIGFGAGAFVRYGPYATGRFEDDVVFTFSVTFTTK